MIKYIGCILLLFSTHCFAVKNVKITIINQSNRVMHLQVDKAKIGSLWHEGQIIDNDSFAINQAKSYVITHTRGKNGNIYLSLRNDDGQFCQLQLNSLASKNLNESDDMNCRYSGLSVGNRVALTVMAFRRV